MEAPAPQVPTGQPSPSLVLPREREEAGERVQFARLEELREKKRRAEVRGELSQSISRFTDPAALPTAIFGVSAQLSGLAGDEPRPLLGRASQLAAQGATLGFADEIEAGIVGATQPLRNLTSFGSGRTMGEAAQQQRDVTRQQLKESREAAPVTSFGLEAAGGGVIGGAPAARFLGQATSRGSLAARSSGLGATTGGVVGFGESEGDFGERLPSAGVGAVTGGLLGGASPLVIEGITRAGSVISRSAGRAFNNIRTGRNVTKDQRRAMNKIMQRVEQDGFTAEQFQARLDRAKELGIESDFIFEMAGPQLLDLAKGGAATGSEAAIKGLAKVRIRQSNVESRVAEDLRAAIGSDGSDFLSRSQSIEKAKIAAAPLYAQFRSLPPIPRSSNVTGRAGGEAGRAAPSEQTLKLESFFDNPLFTRAAKQSASSALSRDGVVIDIEKNLTPDVLDRIKRTIDELINTAQSRTDATAVGDLTALKSRYVSFLDDQYPGIYSSARKAFAGPAAQEEALELGESLIRSAKARRAPE
ncbi:MAG: hypothetical protein JKY52_08600, partial [Flavobacteriales bacterium]|nr:hypothetical protein [Flavobacteriales bacterium]